MVNISKDHNILNEELRAHFCTKSFIFLFLAFCQWVKLKNKEIKWNANSMQLGNFIDVFLARHVSDTYAHYQEH